VIDQVLGGRLRSYEVVGYHGGNRRFGDRAVDGHNRHGDPI